MFCETLEETIDQPSQDAARALWENAADQACLENRVVSIRIVRDSLDGKSAAEIHETHGRTHQEQVAEKKQVRRQYRLGKQKRERAGGDGEGLRARPPQQ